MKEILEILEKYDMDTYHWKLEIAKEIEAFIKENYVSKKQHDVIVKTADDLLLTVKDSYPKEFVKWLIIDQEIFFGELTEKYIVNNNPYKDGKKLNTLDELFDYWQKEVKE